MSYGQFIKLVYTVIHKKSQLIFVCNFVKIQHILMQFSLLHLTTNDTLHVTVWTSPTSPN